MPGLPTATLARIGTVDDRYQSFNVEMLEVIDGKFWKLYGPELDAIARPPGVVAQRGWSPAVGEG